MTIPADLSEAFASFVAGPSLARQAITGVDGATLNRRPPGSDWSIRDHLLFLADYEQFAGTCFRLALTTDEPSFEAPDPVLFLRKLHYLWRDPEAALALFQQARWANAELLERLDGPQWERPMRLDGEPATIATLFASLVTATAERVESLSRR